MKKLLKKNFWITGAIIGAIIGYLYWNYVGCSSGTCVITSKPINSVVYFGIMGAILLSIFQPEKIKSPEKIDGVA